MKFEEALPLLRAGRALRRKNWAAKDRRLVLGKAEAIIPIESHNEIARTLPETTPVFWIVTCKNQLSAWTARSYEILADDWELCPE